MANTKRGIAPLDPTTDVGKFRLASGDSEYEEYDPPQPGFGLYESWSDAEIEAFIEIAGGSIARAIALAYTQMAASWASTGATIRTDDLTYSNKDSVGSWLNLAAYWNKIADDEDDRAINDYFDLVSVRGGGLDCKPELAQWAVCGRGCVGRCVCW